MNNLEENSSSINLDGAVWVPYKELFAIVNSTIYKKDAGRIKDLETALKTHKVDFLRLLKNPAKRAESLNAVKKAATDGIHIVGQQGVRILPQSVVDEALIVSDLFDLNELVALELLLSGESQKARLSTLTRGLAAVLLYYDGRRCLVNSLRALIQARRGRCWTLDLAPEVVDLATKYTDDLWRHGLANHLMCELSTWNVDGERERLDSSRALGDARHRKQVVGLVSEISVSLSECVYCWSCQSGLGLADVVRLLAVLSDAVPGGADGSALDATQFTLLMAVLYAVDVQEDSTDWFGTLPLVADPDFVGGVHQELVGGGGAASRAWKCPPLKSVVQLAWAITLRILSQLPVVQGSRQQYVEEDEAVLEVALEGGALRFLLSSVSSGASFHSEEFFVRRVHAVLTDLVVLFPLKIKELRSRGDELARTSSSVARDEPVHLRELFDLIAAVYSRDPLRLELCLDFWCSSEQPDRDRQSSYGGPTQKQVNLYKFVRLSGDLLPPLLYVPYVRMLSGLAAPSQRCARRCFNLLKANGAGAAGRYGVVSWDHLFASLRRYLLSLQEHRRPGPALTPQELDGLVAFLRLVEVVAAQDDLSLYCLSDNTDWKLSAVFVGLLGCGVPVALKARLVRTLAAFARSPDYAVVLWQSLDASHFLPGGAALRGHVKTELDEVESRDEEYPLTVAFLALLSALLDALAPLDDAGRFDACVQFVVDDVFCKFHLRPYRDVAQKWDVACGCLDVLVKLVARGETGASLSRSAVGKPLGGDLVLSYMLQDTRLVRTLFHVVDWVCDMLVSYVPFPGKEAAERCALLALRLVYLSLERQEAFVSRLRELPTGRLTVAGVHQLLMGVNPRSGRADYVLQIAKFTTLNDLLPEHAFYAVNILLCLSKSSVSQEQVVSSLQPEASLILQGFVECLDVDDPDDEAPDQAEADWSGRSESRTRAATRRSVVRLLVHGLHLPAPNLALVLLGFGTSHRTTLQEPGVLDSPYTCLHACLEILFRSASRLLGATFELCQQLVYTACARADTSRPTLRYLRSSHDFLCRQLRLLLTDDDGGGTGSTPDWQTWLLRTVAIEVRLSAASGQRSNLQRLLSLLLFGGDGADRRLTTTSLDSSSTRCLLLVLLDRLDFGGQAPAPPPTWEVFDARVVEQVLQSCERPTTAPSGYVAVDVHALHRFLLKEVAALQGGAGVRQRPGLAEELKAVLEYAMEQNRVRRGLHSKRQALDAWRVLTETVLVSVPQAEGGTRHVHTVLELVHALLLKLVDNGASLLPELSRHASSVLFALATNLRHCFLELPGRWRTTSWQPFASSLESALRGLVECVVAAGVGPWTVRANYYGAALNLLRLRLDASGCRVLGHDFLAVLCRDSCHTNDVARMLAMCCLSAMAAASEDVVQFLDTHGYLVDHVNRLTADDDRDLQRLLRVAGAAADLMRPLYAYEIKMAFFARLASTANGARLLLGAGLVEGLARMKSLSMKPSTSVVGVHARADASEEEDAASTTYFQVLIPALKVSLLLLVSPVSKSSEAKSQVMDMLVAHSECLGSLLRDAVASTRRTTTTEDAVVAAVFSQSFACQFPAESVGLVYPQLARLWCLAQSLLPALVASKWARSSSGDDDDLGWTRAVTSLLSFCVALSQAPDDSVPRLTFGPVMSADDDAVPEDCLKPLDSLPDMRLLVFLLSHCSDVLCLMRRRQPELGGGGGGTSKDALPDQDDEAPGGSSKSSQLSERQRLSICMIEHTLFLLYYHLEFYVVRSWPSGRFASQSPPERSRLRKLDAWGTSSSFSRESAGGHHQQQRLPVAGSDRFVSKDVVSALQSSSQKLLSESALKNLVELCQSVQEVPDDDRCRFVNVMARRLRSITSLPLER